MKKILLLSVIVLILSSCGSAEVIKESKKVMKGDWQLESVTYSETGSFKVSLLDDTTAKCFEGSQWHFVPNNYTGTYQIVQNDCPTGERYFVFSIQEKSADTGLYDFLLKPTDDKHKSESKTGYRLHLSQLTETQMQWSQSLMLEGNPFTIYMNFTKITK